MGPFPAHIFISFSALAKSPSSAHLFLQGCRVHDHRLPGRGDDDHPGLRQVRVVPRPLQQQHGEYTTLNLTFSGGKQEINLNGRYFTLFPIYIHFY